MILKGNDGIPNVLFSNKNSFVMEPLCYKICSFNKLDLDRIINIIQNVHTQGIVHRAPHEPFRADPELISSWLIIW